MNHHHHPTPFGFWASGILALSTQMVGTVAAFNANDYHVVASNVSVTLTILISTTLLAGMVLNLSERITGWPPKRRKKDEQ